MFNFVTKKRRIYAALSVSQLPKSFMMKQGVLSKNMKGNQSRSSLSENGCYVT